MAPVNELLRDIVVSAQVDLSQYSQGVARRMVAVLNRADAQLAAELLAALDRMPAVAFTVQRLEAMLEAVRQINRAAYDRVHAALMAELRDFAEVQAWAEYAALQRTIPTEVQVRFAIASVAPEQVYSAALARPFQGRLLRDWAAKVAEDRMVKVREAVRVGYLEGQTVTDIVRRIRGTKAALYQDGVLNRSRQELMTVVDTAVKHHAAVARDRTIEANARVVAAVIWSSTLDGRTSPQCRLRDGLRYTADTHKPIGHKVPYGAGPGRLHFRCRSSAQPVTRSWRELGFDYVELTPQTRASMGGQVPADMTYREWLKRQPAGRQDEVLGPTRGRLMREGRLDPGDMYSNTGQWLTLAQLRKRYGDEFKRLGL